MPSAPHDDVLIFDAWERFVSGAPANGLPVRKAILQSWERSHRLAVDLGAATVPLLDEELKDGLQRGNSDLLEASGLALAELGDTLHDSEIMLLLADAGGVGLQSGGDRRTVYAGCDIGLSVGGQWSEQFAGTNGIGIALATAAPAFVYASEHYCKGIKGWSCGAAPIFDSVDGSLAGILNVSSKATVWTSRGLAEVVSVARQIEQRLTLMREVQHRQVLEACLSIDRRSDQGIIAVDHRGRLIYHCDRVPHFLSSRFGLPRERWMRGHRLFHQGAPEPTFSSCKLDPMWIHRVEHGGQSLGFVITVPELASRAPQRSVPSALRASRTGATAPFERIIGESAAIRTAIDQARAITGVRVPVLVEGETGVGKELFARAVHEASGADKPFVAFNCGAVAADMIASELFGYVGGAFTGANAKGRVGRFEEANGGTLCLDEIGELPQELQPYLLRALEEGEICRLGENRTRRVDVRVIAMTNRSLREQAALGRFRRDLYYRLDVARLEVPPLRARIGDIDLLVDHFARLVAERHGRQPITFTPEAMVHLRRYEWPGNVRELRNAVERAIIFTLSDTIGLSHLSSELHDPELMTTVVPSRPLPVGLSRDAIEGAFAASGGNMSLAAELLGISRSTLYRKMEQYGIAADAAAIRGRLRRPAPRRRSAFN